MKIADIVPMPEYFDLYINQAENTSLLRAFDNSLLQLQNLDISKLKRLEAKRYEPGKWTVKEIFQHISDTERIAAAGVLRVARNDSSYVVSFSKIPLPNAGNTDSKRIEQLLYEMETVRRATISLYKSLTQEDLLKTGINSQYPIDVLGMGFNIIGHQAHHMKIIEERYYPLLK